MSQAVVAGNMVFISGQVADDPRGSILQQTGDVLAKIERLLAQAGATKSDLVNVGVFLPNIVDFDAMNSVYDAWIDPSNARRPAPASRLVWPTRTFGSRSRRWP